MRSLLLLLLTCGSGLCLSMMSMMDDVTIALNEYLEVDNFNEATIPLVDSHAEID